MENYRIYQRYFFTVPSYAWVYTFIYYMTCCYKHVSDHYTATFIIVIGYNG